MLRTLALAAAAIFIGKKLYDHAGDPTAPDPSAPAGHIPSA